MDRRDFIKTADMLGAGMLLNGNRAFAQASQTTNTTSNKYPGIKNILSANHGMLVSLDTHTQLRAGVQRPRIIIPETE